MNNFFLLNEAIDIADFQLFKEGMGELNNIKSNTQNNDDVFLKHDSIYNLPILETLYSNTSYDGQIISQFIEQLRISENYLRDEVTFDSFFPNDANAFLGIDFSTLPISATKQIIDVTTFNAFKNTSLWDISYRNLWEKRGDLFPNLILCGEVENQIAKTGNSPILHQIIDRLTTLNDVAKEWKKRGNDFNYKLANRSSSLRISPESEQTMKKYGNERVFSLPDGGRKTFELHIKTGNLRFHFYPDNNTKIIYVGYIGPHLSTISN